MNGKSNVNALSMSGRIQSEEHDIQNGAGPIRQSLIYLRDDAGFYYQMEEEQYMRLQLDEMQNTANQVAQGDITSTLPLNADAAHTGSFHKNKKRTRLVN